MQSAVLFSIECCKGGECIGSTIQRERSSRESFCYSLRTLSQSLPVCTLLGAQVTNTKFEYTTYHIVNPAAKG
jgi:hypothetical protein